MDNSVFEQYFIRTVWQDANSTPTYDELREMENQCIKVLMNAKGSEYPQYRYTYAKYGLELINRIGFCNRKIDDGSATPEIRKLKDSYERFRINLRSLDRNLYEREFRTAIQKAKRERKSRQIAQTPFAEPKQLQEQPKAAFFNTSLTKNKAEALYVILVNDGYLADTGKDDFVYYFTGVGEQPKNKLEWKADLIILSVLIEKIACTNRMPWRTMTEVFGVQNIDSMKTNLSRERKRFEEGYQQTSYQRHAEMIDNLLM